MRLCESRSRDSKLCTLSYRSPILSFQLDHITSTSNSMHPAIWFTLRSISLVFLSPPVCVQAQQESVNDRTDSVGQHRRPNTNEPSRCSCSGGVREEHSNRCDTGGVKGQQHIVAHNERRTISEIETKRDEASAGDTREHTADLNRTGGGGRNRPCLQQQQP